MNSEQYAQTLAAKGFHVFPLQPNSKLPAINDFANRATNDPEQIKKFWIDPVLEVCQPYNVGVSTSKYNGGQSLVVVDVDNKEKKNGSAEVERLKIDGFDFPNTLTQLTPTGGLHLIYKTPKPVKQGINVLAPGLDIRAKGGFIVGAGSIIDGKSYQLQSDDEIAECPEWILEKCGPTAEKERSQNILAEVDSPQARDRAILYLKDNAPISYEGNGGDETAYKVAASLKDFGVTREIALELMLENWNERCEPPWLPVDLKKKIDNAYRYGQKPIGVRAPEKYFDRIEDISDADSLFLDLDTDALHQLASKAEESLIKANAPIYSRGATLVRPVVEEVEASRGRRTKVARLSHVNADCLVDHLSRATKFLRYNARKKKKTEVHPPRAIAQTILSRDGEWKFPALAGVITTPTLRPDYTLLSKLGFDLTTRLLLADSPTMPKISEVPTKDEATDSLQILKDLLSEFPFTSESSRSVALSALISPVVRGAMSVVPLHATSAPSPGSGKSYLNDLASAIATGQPCPVIAAGRSEEETEKRIGAALITGQPIISIDNLNGELGGDALCQFVERPFVEIRPLGRSSLIRVESKATIFATGNNLTLVGDMVRRVLLCTLDSDSERPELRRFSKDPLQLVLENRGKYIAAALTVARAYAVADFPGVLPSLASFGDWSRLVRSALVWLGCADPVETIDLARSEDPEVSQIRDIVCAWKDAVGCDVGLTTGELLQKASQTPLFETLQSISSGKEPMDAKKLGYWLRRRKGRIVQGLKIVSEYNSHSKQMKWSLKAIETAGDAGKCGYDSGRSPGNDIRKENSFLKSRAEHYPQIPASPATDAVVTDSLALPKQNETEEYDIFS